ncbi:MAG TPA: spermidine/putrescine ABC transporter substrate-binding protein [Actinomycetota bacterium]|nr:spermidine/putrescine ABC transporter substrate-binding protein [Actinomycetota bacterium]
MLRLAATGGTGVALAVLLALGIRVRSSDEPTAGTGPIGQRNWAAWWAQQVRTNSFVFANWPYYIDRGDGGRPSLELFMRETSTYVDYRRPIRDLARFYERIRPALESGEPTGYDLMVITNGPWLAKLIRNGWLTPLDHERLPNFAQHASDLAKAPPWDPGNRYSVAWQSGLTGIAYRPEAVEVLGRKPRSIHDLFDPRFAGRVGMMTDLMDLGSSGLLALGIEPSTSTAADWPAASVLLSAQRTAGLVRKYYGQSYLFALRRGDVWITQAWSGDIFQLNQEGHPEVEFVVPDEGAMFWTDNMVIPVHTEHAVDAITYMDYVYQPTIAAMIADWVWYISPVPEARDIIANEFDNQAVADSPLVFPDAVAGPEFTGRFHSYRVFETEEEETEWNRVFGSVVST